MLPGQAVAADGPHPLLDDAVAFVAARLHADGPKLVPAYSPPTAGACRTSVTSPRPARLPRRL